MDGPSALLGAASAARLLRLTLEGGGPCAAALESKVLPCREREFFIDNLLFRIHSIIVMMRWTGLAPWEFEFPLQVILHLPS